MAIISNNSTLSSEEGEFDPTHLGFSSIVFYFAFLPPIIFCSGYHLKRKLFFRSFFSILLMAVIGTCLSTAMISTGVYFMDKSPLFDPLASFNLTSMECVAFGALLSSIDPVSELIPYHR